MNIDDFINGPAGEKPLDRLVPDGGYCGIFRRIGCVGDSLSSGEFESMDENGNRGYHDMFEYSWGQYIARMTGSKVYNFSQGGMTAEQYCESFADHWGFFNNDKLCQAYIIALGVNEIYQKKLLGSISDIDINDYNNNQKTFAGYYAKIIQRLKQNQPKAKFFLMTPPRTNKDEDTEKEYENLSEIIRSMAKLFDYTYILDFRKYAPVYDQKFKDAFYLGGHMNPMGYMLTAKMTASYIDYIVRHNMDDFKQVGFIGTPVHNVSAKW